MAEERVMGILRDEGGGPGRFGQLGTLGSFSHGHLYTASSEHWE